MNNLRQTAQCRIGHKLAGLMLLLLLIPLQASLASEGKYYGAIPSEKPDWFKESFLEFEDDVAEATAAGRRVMLYFHQDGCPYCARLVEENFTDPELKAFIIENFDGITLNMWGDREVVSVAGQAFTEKVLPRPCKCSTPRRWFFSMRMVR